MDETRSVNPQTDSPSESIAKFRGRVSPNSNLTLREQNRLYFDEMGGEVLERQLKLGRRNNTKRKVK